MIRKRNLDIFILTYFYFFLVILTVKISGKEGTSEDMHRDLYARNPVIRRRIRVDYRGKPCHFPL